MCIFRGVAAQGLVRLYSLLLSTMQNSVFVRNTDTYNKIYCSLVLVY